MYATLAVPIYHKSINGKLEPIANPVPGIIAYRRDGKGLYEVTVPMRPTSRTHCEEGCYDLHAFEEHMYCHGVDCTDPKHTPEEKLPHFSTEIVESCTVYTRGNNGGYKVDIADGRIRASPIKDYGEDDEPIKYGSPVLDMVYSKVFGTTDEYDDSPYAKISAILCKSGNTWYDITDQIQSFEWDADIVGYCGWGDDFMVTGAKDDKGNLISIGDNGYEFPDSSGATQVPTTCVHYV